MNKGFDSVGMKKLIPPEHYTGFGKPPKYKSKHKSKRNKYKTFSSEEENSSNDSLFGSKGKSND